MCFWHGPTGKLHLVIKGPLKEAEVTKLAKKAGFQFKIELGDASDDDEKKADAGQKENEALDDALGELPEEPEDDEGEDVEEGEEQEEPTTGAVDPATIVAGLKSLLQEVKQEDLSDALSKEFMQKGAEIQTTIAKNPAGAAELLTAAQKRLAELKKGKAAWLAEFSRVDPIYQAALREQPARANQLRNVMNFANSKAEAGNYAAAVQALTQLSALIGKGPSDGVTTLPAEALQAWTTARNDVVNQIRATAKAMAVTMPADAKSAIIELESIIKNLTPTPANARSIAELRNYVEHDDVITSTENPPEEWEFDKLNIRQPLKDALAQFP
jgi:hypothetical protein